MKGLNPHTIDVFLGDWLAWRSMEHGVSTDLAYINNFFCKSGQINLPPPPMTGEGLNPYSDWFAWNITSNKLISAGLQLFVAGLMLRK